MLEQPTDSIQRSIRLRQDDWFSPGTTSTIPAAPIPLPPASKPHQRRDLVSKSDNRHAGQSRYSRLDGNSQPNRPHATNSLSLFLRQALGTPLLDKREEKQLAMEIHRYRQAFQRLVVKEPAVLRHLVSLLRQWQNKKLRLDALCNLALSETAKRKILEPKLRTNTRKLSRLIKQIENESSSTELRRLQRLAIESIEALNLRPKVFESAPFQNPKAHRLLEQYRRKCQAMTQANLRLVVDVTKKLCGRSPVLLDMIQEGCRGLMHAVTKFDYRRDIRFSTYATPWIKQTVFAALPNAERNIRVPENFGSLARTVHRKWQQSSENEWDRGHSDSGRTMERIADELNMSATEINRIVCVQRDTSSLNHPSSSTTPEGNSSHSSLGELIRDRRPSPMEQAQARERKEFLRNLMARALNQREREVISLRFGFEDGKDRSLAEVGRQMGITRERARQVEKKAMAKLSQCRQPSEFV